MRGVLKHPLSLVLFTLGSLLVLVSLYGTVQKTKDSTKNVSALQQEIIHISDEVTSLEEEVNQAKTPLEQEKIIRNELLMQKDGEVIVQLPELPEDELVVSVSPSPKPWQEWQGLLF